MGDRRKPVSVRQARRWVPGCLDFLTPRPESGRIPDEMAGRTLWVRTAGTERMMVRFIAGLCTSLAAMTPSAMVSGEPLLADAELQRVGLARYWQAELPMASGRLLRAGYLVDDALYVTADNGFLYALTADAGLLRWADRVTEPDYTIFPPTHVASSTGKGAALIPTTSGVLLLDRFNGGQLRRFTTPFPTSGPILAGDGRILAGSSDGKFYSLRFDVESGQPPFKLWEVVTDGPITTAPVLVNPGKLVFATQGGSVYACGPADKSFLWQYQTGGAIVSDPVVDPSGVYVASTDRSLYRLDLDTGVPVWRVRMSTPLDSAPVVVAHTVYQYSYRDGLTAFDADTGAEKWRRPEGRWMAAHGTSGDLILTGDERLLLVDHETGSVKGTIAADGVTGVVRNMRDDAAYLLGTNGRVICVRLATSPYLRRQQVAASKQQLNLPPAEASSDADLPKEESEKSKPRPNPFRSRREP